MHRLAFRFLTLPFRKKYAVAKSLGILSDDDHHLTEGELFRKLLSEASKRNLLAKLWEETEKQHHDPATNNPFLKN